MSLTPALPQNLLVVHIAGISQTMLALPALHALRAHLPQAHITVASSSTAAELIELANVANTVLPVGRLRRAEWLRPRAAIDYRPERCAPNKWSKPKASARAFITSARCERWLRAQRRGKR